MTSTAPGRVASPLVGRPAASAVLITSAAILPLYLTWVPVLQVQGALGSDTVGTAGIGAIAVRPRRSSHILRHGRAQDSPVVGDRRSRRSQAAHSPSPDQVRNVQVMESS